jgi:integrase
MARPIEGRSISQGGRTSMAAWRCRTPCVGGRILEGRALGRPGGYLHVVNGKGGKQRTSILPKPVLEALQNHLNGQDVGYVFQGRDSGHISTRQIQRLLDNVAEKAGLQETRKGKVRQRKRITPHLLRHSFSRWSLDAGIDISYLQQQLGHSSLSTTAIYLRARPNHRRKAYENAGFDKLLNPC